MTERDLTRAIIFRRRAAFIAASLAGAGCASGADQRQPVAEMSTAQPAPETATPRHEPTPAPSSAPVSPPPPPAVMKVCLSIKIMPRIEFAQGTIVPTPESLAVIVAAYETLVSHPGTRIVIEGHRDASERDLANELARDRAIVVEQQLTTRGIDPARLCTTDFGDSRPLTPGRTNEERAKNRRVSFRLMEDGEDCP